MRLRFGCLLLLGFLLLLGSPFQGSPAAPTSINTIPAKPYGTTRFVTDLGHLLSPEEQETLNTELKQIAETGTTEIAIVSLPDTDQALSVFAPKIFNSWGIGDREKDNGLLILLNAKRIVAKQSGNRIFIATGLGIQDRLPDARVGRILDTITMPAFAEGHYATGLSKTVQALTTALSTASTASSAKESEAVDWDQIIFWIIVMIVLLQLLFQKKGVYTRGGTTYWGNSSTADSSDFGGGGDFGGGSSDGGGAGR